MKSQHSRASLKYARFVCVDTFIGLQTEKNMSLMLAAGKGIK